MGPRGGRVGERKLGFVGVVVSRGICRHGFALSVAADLGAFHLFAPCGLEVAATAIGHHR
jgi:lipoate-protein ligase B